MEALDDAGAEGGPPETTVGRALAWVAPRRRLAPAPFLAATAALVRERGVAAFLTRKELVGHLASCATPRGDALLATFGLATERRLALLNTALVAEACAEVWSRAQEPLAGGTLWIPVEDLTAHGIGIQELPALDPRALGAVLAELAADARARLRRAGDLARELGPWRGRLAAAWLRRIDRRLAAVPTASRRS